MDVILYSKLMQTEKELASIYTSETKSETKTESISGLVWETGYVTNGTETASSSYYHTEIPVLFGDSIQPKKANNDNVPIRFCDLMNGTTVVQAISNTHPIDVPTGVTSIVISVAKTYVDAEGFSVKRTRTVSSVTEAGTLAKVKNHVLNTNENGITFRFDLQGNSVFADPQNRNMSDACGYSMAFSAKIPATITGQIVIGKGYNNSDGCAVGLDSENIYVYENGALIGSPSYSQLHGLTLKDYISIEVDVYYSLTDCKIRIKTNGGEYTWTPTRWRSQDGILSARSTLDNLSSCVLSYACPALDNEIWMYGDSYLSWHNPARWAYWLVEAGHTKYLLNSDPGRTSEKAYQSFLTDISMNKIPKKILWLMGMNDKDGDNAPNENWKTAVESMKDFCNEKGIELILATIPNVPSSATKNTLKNAYVVASGYRYIDWANAVSADGSSTWYDNMLNEDNVHPNKEGAKALYVAAVTTVPELLK